MLTRRTLPLRTERLPTRPRSAAPPRLHQRAYLRTACCRSATNSRPALRGRQVHDSYRNAAARAPSAPSKRAISRDLRPSRHVEACLTPATTWVAITDAGGVGGWDYGSRRKVVKDGSLLQAESRRGGLSPHMGSEMQQTPHQFRESLKGLEQDTLGGLDVAAQQLDRALESVTSRTSSWPQQLSPATTGTMGATYSRHPGRSRCA
jgi:hypothetical protein